MTVNVIFIFLVCTFCVNAYAPRPSLSIGRLNIKHFKSYSTLLASDEAKSSFLAEESDLISTVKSFITSDFGSTAPEVLASDFVFEYGGRSIKDKSKYFSAFLAKTSAVRRCLTDLTLKPSCFVVDKNENLVSFIIRPSGTITGPFAIDGDVIQPSDGLKNKIVEFPPQQITVTLDDGKVKYISIFVFHMLIKNSNIRIG